MVLLGEPDITGLFGPVSGQSGDLQRDGPPGHRLRGAGGQGARPRLLLCRRPPSSRLSGAG